MLKCLDKAELIKKVVADIRVEVSCRVLKAKRRKLNRLRMTLNIPTEKSLDKDKAIPLISKVDDLAVLEMSKIYHAALTLKYTASF